MAVLTELEPGRAVALAANYGLELVSVEPIAKGSVNSNFFLSTGSGRFFLRIFEEQDEQGAAYETALLGHLSQSGVPTPAPLRDRNGKTTTKVGHKPAALFPCVPGEELCQARVDADVAQQVGRALALVHLGAAGFSERRRGRFEAADLLARIVTIDEGMPLEPPQLLDWLRVELERPLPDLPRGVIHGDLFRDNVLWSGGRIGALLDFESASDGLWAYDLAVTLLAWTFTSRFEPKLVAALIDGYLGARTLSREEWTALPRLAHRAAARFIVTRITDFLMRRSQRGIGVYKDYRRFVARRDAIDAGLAPLIATR